MLGLTALPSPQISDMLQKDPELRPSAKDIFTHTLPQLTSSFKSTEEEEEEEEGDESDAAKTKAKYKVACCGHVTLM